MLGRVFSVPQLWILREWQDEGRRRCLYAPLTMVPLLKRALENGRQIEKLLYEMGPALVKEYRLQNPAQTGPAVALSRSSAKLRKSKS